MDIVVRRAEPEDYEAVWRTFQDESAYSGTLQPPFPSREVWRKRIAEMPEGDFMLVALVDGEIVGNAGLHSAGKSPRRAHVMHLGMTVREEWQGKGVGTALMRALTSLADGWLNVFRIELTVYIDNERALALYRKFGFVVEGTHKAYALRGGRYVDSHSMARVKPKTSPV
jgi:L-phenylalanine/L-methionine N-acetyltransferase